MRLILILHVFSITTALAISMVKHDCDPKCGNVTIPYPFGVGPKCSANSSFAVTCNKSTNPATLTLSSIKMEVLDISLYGTVIVKQPVSQMNCSDVLTTESLPISLKGSPFTMSAAYNSLVVLGCKNSVWLRVNRTSAIGGCTALCDDKSNDASCNGVNCCQTTVPPRKKELQYTYRSNEATNESFCGYVFPVDKKWLANGYKNYKGGILSNLSTPFDGKVEFVPLVLEWEFGELKGLSNDTCTYYDDHCLSHPDVYGRRFPDYPVYYNSFSDCRRRNGDHDYEDQNYVMWNDDSYNYLRAEYDSSISSTKYCSCREGFEGNPYLDGCSAIDYCSRADICPPEAPVCISFLGSYGCIHPVDKRKIRVRLAFFFIGIVLGGLLLLIGAVQSAKAIKKRIKANRKRKFFKRNGGLLLEQQLSSTDSGLAKTKLFGSKVLTQATDHYNENRILGRGGQGTVYKGMLTDGKIVAVKKSKKVDEGDLVVFINEVVILSQVNHRNVVKLLGCCLETEVPLLVYEFIPNGTLFQHIHEPNEDFPLTWEMRVRIAQEIAGALAYLHSAASTPIYHRDIKSTNILLDDKYRAKVADFGTSKSISIDQTHLTTRVVGTFGYMDPEYFRSSQFTEKSDVYSFGVVIVELLTGEKAISKIRVEEGRGLAMFFLDSMEENQLFDILDARVLEEGKKEEVVAIAELARRCLQLNGRSRPTMKEVAVELEGIQMCKEGSNCLQNQDKSRDRHFAEVESFIYSSISDSMNLDSITPYSPDADRPLLDEP